MGGGGDASPFHQYCTITAGGGEPLWLLGMRELDTGGSILVHNLYLDSQVAATRTKAWRCGYVTQNSRATLEVGRSYSTEARP